MRVLIISFLFFPLLSFGQQPIFECVKTLDLSNSDWVSNAQIDNDGNLYVIGDFSGERTVDFPIQVIDSSSNYYPLLVRYNSKGEVTLVKHSKTRKENFRKLALSSNGKIAIYGQYDGDAGIEFDNFSIPKDPNFHPLSNHNYVFIVQLDSLGTVEYLEKLPSANHIREIGYNTDNNLIISVAKPVAPGMGATYPISYIYDSKKGNIIDSLDKTDVSILKYASSILIRKEFGNRIYYAVEYTLDSIVLGQQKIFKSDSYSNSAIAIYENNELISLKSYSGEVIDIKISSTGYLVLGYSIDSIINADQEIISNPHKNLIYVIQYDKNRGKNWTRKFDNQFYQDLNIAIDKNNFVYFQSSYRKNSTTSSCSENPNNQNTIIIYEKIDEEGNNIWCKYAYVQNEIVYNFWTIGLFCFDDDLYSIFNLKDQLVQFDKITKNTYNNGSFITKINQHPSILSLPETEIDFTIYPNPSNGSVRIDLNGALAAKATQIVITDILGQRVHRAVTDQFNIVDVSRLSAGIYNVTVHTFYDGNINKKLIVSK